ncbi:MAG: hypothetical protein PF482_15810 [Desulfobacteraceae bacterium]|nr:hypothetical protein [Desulfobacteraceae bacterium]
MYTRFRLQFYLIVFMSMRAVFHLTEELSYRKKLASLPEHDRAHLCGDIKRVYKLLVTQWVDYMIHLKDFYPYLFSLEVRMSPYNPEASAITKKEA